MCVFLLLAASEWVGSRPSPSAAWPRGLLFVNVSISCVPWNVELFNLNFPRCAEAPLSLGPAALPCPWHKAITHKHNHTHSARTSTPLQLCASHRREMGKTLQQGERINLLTQKLLKPAAPEADFQPRGFKLLLTRVLSIETNFNPIHFFHFRFYSHQIWLSHCIDVYYLSAKLQRSYCWTCGKVY